MPLPQPSVTPASIIIGIVAIPFAMHAVTQQIQLPAHGVRNIITSSRKTHKSVEPAKALPTPVIAQPYVLSHIITMSRPFVKNAPAIWIRQHVASARTSSTHQHKLHVSSAQMQ